MAVWVRLTSVLVAVSLSTSCGGHTDLRSRSAGSAGPIRVSAVPQITSKPAPTSSSAITLPLDAYVFAAADAAVVSKAEELLITDCMRGAGFSYQTTASSQRSLSVEHDEPFGVIDPVKAGVYGYHDPSLLNGSKKFMQTRPGWMTDAYLVALQGWSTPPQSGQKTPPGCQDAAHATLLGKQQGDPNLIGQLAVAAEQRTEADARVTAAEAAWSACMVQHGYHFATPQVAAAGPWSAAMQPPAPAEIATATTDVACKQNAGLVSTWLAVESAYQQLGIDQNAATLAQIQLDTRAEVVRAQAVLTNH